ncbi:TPA: hypothetical protein ACK3JH_000192 [Mannheimia haemolytica]
MLSLYAKKIRDAQRAIKYDFWDYLMKIEDKPEFEKLIQEINFSSEIIRNLKLYEDK